MAGIDDCFLSSPRIVRRKVSSREQMSISSQHARGRGGGPSTGRRIDQTAASNPGQSAINRSMACRC
jgi:hypothetical protein